jgi:ABC-2 type transport system permease protein
LCNKLKAGAARAQRRWRTWATVFDVYLQDNLTYRSQALIWMMTDAVPAVLMPLVWLASYNGRPAIRGFTPPDMIAYYLTNLALANFMVTHIMWDMATDIREGRFSIFLTRPFGYLPYQYAGNLSWRLMRLVLFLPVFLVCVWIFHDRLVWRHYSLGAEFWLAVLGGHLLSFAIGYTMGLLALFFTEVRSIFMFYYMPFTFLSGQVVPLAMLPDWAHHAAFVAPFRYTLSFPAEILLGQAAGESVRNGLLVLAAWIVGMYFLTGLLWRAGLRRYTAVGM